MLLGHGGNAHETQLEEFCKDPNYIHQDAIKHFANHFNIPESHIYQIVFPEGGWCGEIEHYHRWSDGWDGMCFNGLCEYCTKGQPNKNKVEHLKNKIKHAEQQYKVALKIHETHLTANCSEKPPVYNTSRFKDLPWYKEHCRLWQIQSHLQSQVSTLQRRLEELLQGYVISGKELVKAVTENNLE